jgi:Protein of unknown function (DUF551)
MKANWIPCSERFPEDEQDVWVYMPRYPNPVRFARYQVGYDVYDTPVGGTFGFVNQDTDYGEATHWAPLEFPEPPTNIPLGEQTAT